MRRMRYFLLILTLFLFAVQPTSPIRAVGENFPIGVVLEYHTEYHEDSDDFEWIHPQHIVQDERYEVLRWATEVGPDIVAIRVTITGISDDTIFIDTSTWYQVNAVGDYVDYIYPPLWVDLSGWFLWAQVMVTSHGSYYRLQPSQFVAGGSAYTCWQAVRIPSIFDSLSTGYDTLDDILYYDAVRGVLLGRSYYAERTFMPGTVTYSQSITLIEHNLESFGLIPTEIHIRNFAIIGGICLVVVVGLIIWARRRRASSKPSLVRDRVQEVEEDIADDGVELSCIVCRGAIKSGAKTLECPRCGGVAHRRHLLEWVRVKGRCPLCRRKLRTRDFM